jgi:hypothetical protein
MSLLRLLNPQGIAGLAVAFTLFVMLTVQKLEAVRWKRQTETYEQLYQQEQAAFATSVANYRTAAAQAELADKANAERVAAEQRAINERTSNDYQARLAAAHALAQRLRSETSTAAADPGRGGGAPVPGLAGATDGPAQAAREDQLPQSDRLIATEQAIQLDELIKWLEKQAAVDPNGTASVVDSKRR